MIWIKDTCLRFQPTVARKERRMFSIFECEKCGSLIEAPKHRGIIAKHCGCAKTTINSDIERKIHASWISMHTRCYNTRTKDYKYYGGKGIRVCERWLSGEKYSFKNFLDDMAPTYFTGASLDRKDSDLDYNPDNCRWLTVAENTRRAHKDNIQSQETKDKRAESLRQITEDKAKEIVDFLENHTLKATSKKFGWHSSSIRKALIKYGYGNPRLIKNSKDIL